MSKDPTQFWSSEEMKSIAEKLIPEHHKHLIDFSVNIKYLFTNKVPKIKGKEVWGQVHKITGRNAYLAKDNPDGEPFFTITVPKDIFDILPEEKKVALVDHYLCQCWAEVKQAKEEAIKKKNTGNTDAILSKLLIESFKPEYPILSVLSKK